MAKGAQLANTVTLSDTFLVALKHYAEDPVGFCEDVLNVKLFDWQKEALEGLAKKRKLAVKSGRGVGKTRLMACTILWMLLTHWPIKIVVTAPTFPQLRQIVFPEVRTVAQSSKIMRYIRWTPTEIHAKIAPGIVSMAAARTGRSKEAVAGFHAPTYQGLEGAMVVMADEASGVAPEFFESLRGSNTGKNNFFVYTGNPTRTSGEFYDTFKGEETAKRWHLMTVASTDVPSVDHEYIEEMVARYGEDSDPFRVHVLGEFPTGNLNGLIPLPWLRQAKLVSARNFSKLASLTDGFTIGVDVARRGEDSSVITVRQGRYVLGDYTEQFRGMTTDELTVHVKALYDELLRISPYDPVREKVLKPVVCVDSTGIGAGVFDQLKVKGVNALEVVVAESAPDTFPRCHRLRDWLYWQMREFFNPENDMGAVLLLSNKSREPYLDSLIVQASQLSYDFTPSDAIKIEQKIEYKKRNDGTSPDFADSLALTFAAHIRVKSGPKKQSHLWKKQRPAVGWVP